MDTINNSIQNGIKAKSISVIYIPLNLSAPSVQPSVTLKSQAPTPVKPMPTEGKKP